MIETKLDPAFNCAIMHSQPLQSNPNQSCSMPAIKFRTRNVPVSGYLSDRLWVRSSEAIAGIRPTSDQTSADWE